MGKNCSDDENTVNALGEIVERLDPPPDGLIETAQFAVGVQTDINVLADDD